MNARISSKQRASLSPRGARAQQPSRQLRYKHLAFGVGLALGSLLVCGMAAAAGTVAPNQSPTGGKVVGGQGSITQSGASTVINQQSKLLALDWQTFNVGKDASVLFNQPGASAIALNRILDQNPSQIFGKVTSNGQIFLINTHGIIFGASAQLNVGGLVASTLDLTPQDFLKEHFSLDAHGGSAGVVNHGTIAAASGGSVSLVGGQVENDGLIVADYGHINLDGADRAVLDFDGNGLISVEITGALQKRLNADQAAVTNKGTLKATSGTVVLQASAAKNLFTDMVNNSGVIKAGGISTAGGVVRLVGSGGDVISSGSIDASGSHGGSVQVLSDGNVGVSGSIHADATQNGRGGDILVNGDDSATVSGTLTARGGALGGDGGFIETSGAHVHFGDNLSVNTLAPFGHVGLWLIDPQDFTIATTGGDMTPTLLQSQLGTNDVEIKSSGGATAGQGDINVNDAVAWNQHTLTLTAARDVNINANMTATGSAGLVLQPATTNTTGGTTDNGVNGGTTIIDSAAVLSLSGTGTMTLGSLVDNGTVDISGLGSGLTLQSLAGGSSGKVKLGNNDLTLNNALATIGAANTFAGVISGNGAVALTGGMQAFSGANTYKGGTTISGGTLQVTGDSSLGDAAGDVTINSGGILQAGGDITSTRTIHIANVAHIDTNGHAVALSGDVTSGDGSQGSLDKDGAGTLTLSGADNLYKYTNVNAGTLALAGAGVLGGQFVNVGSGATFDISQLTAAGVTALTLDGAGTVALGSKSLTIGNGNTAWTFSGMLQDGGIGGGAGGSFVMDDPGVTGVLSGTNTYTGDTTIKSGTLSVSSDANLGTGNLILDGGTLENTASFTLNRAVSITSNGGTLQNDAATNLTVANAITGTGDLTQNGPGTLTLDADVTTTGANQTYNGAVALGGDVNLSGSTVTLNGVTGNSHNLTVTGDAVLDGALASVNSLHVTGATNLGIAGVTTTGTQDYDGNLALNGGNTTLTGSTVTVNGVVGNGNSLTVTGNAALNGTIANISALSVSGTTALGTASLSTTGDQNYTGAVTLANDSTLTSTGGSVIFGSTVDSATATPESLTVNATAGAASFGGNVGATHALNDLTADSDTFNAAGDLKTTGDLSITTSGGPIAQAAASIWSVGGTSALNAGANAITLANASNDFGGPVALTGGTVQIADANALTLGTLATGALTATSTGALNLGSGNVGGNLTATSNGGTVTEGSGGLTVVGATTINAGAGSITLDAAGNNFQDQVNLANSGANNVALDNGSNALTLGTVNVGTGTLDISATGITQAAGTWVVQASGAGAASFDARSGVLSLDSGFNDLTGTVNLANSGNNLVYLDNGGDALTLGTLNVGSGPLTITDYGSGALLLTNDVTTSGGAVTFGGGVTIDGSPAITIDTTGGAAAGANISFGGDVNAASAGADSLTLTAGTGAVNFGGSVGNTAALDDLTTTGDTFNAAGDLKTAGNLSITAAGGPIAQAAASTWSVGGTSTLNAGANAITLANASNDFGGPVALTGGTVQITDANALTLGTLAAGALTVNSTGALKLGSGNVGGTLIATSNGGAVTEGSGGLTVVGATTINAGAGSITLDAAGNNFQDQVNLANSGANNVALDNGSHALKLGNVGVGTGTLDLSGTGITQVAGTGIVQAPGAGAASFDARGGVLNLNSTLNDLTGTVNLANSGNNLVYLDNGGNALTLGTLNVGSGPLTITDYGIGALLLTQDITTNGGAVSFGGGVTIDGSPAITIDTTGGGAAGANISFGGDVNAASAGADSLTLTAGTGAVNFGGSVGNTATLANLTTASKTFSAAGTLGIGGDLSITTTGGPISQGGAWSVGGASNFNAGSNAVTLASGSNSFGGPITVTGGAVELAGTGTLDMGTVTATSLKLDGASTLHDDISTSGAQIYNGAVTLDGSGNSVALHGNGISFGSTVDNLSSADPQDFTVDSGTGAAQFGGAVGSLNGPLGALVVNGTGQAQFLGNVAAASLTANAPVLLDAGVNTSGNQTYNGAVALGSSVAVASANGNVSFASTVDNAVAGTPEALTVTAANGKVTFGNAVGTLNGQLGNLTSSSDTFSATGTLAIGGDLTLTTTGGAIGQSAAWTVVGNSIFNAGNYAVALTNPNNDFTGSVTLTGAGVSVRDVNDLTIGGLTDNDNGNVSLVAGGQLFGVGPINAGTGSITLTAAGAVLTTAALTGGDVTLTGGNGISVGDDINASGTLTLASGGNIDEASTAVISADALTGNATGSAHLDGNNLIANIGNFTANGFSLTNAQALTVGAGITIDGGAGGTALTTTAGDLTINGTVGNAAGATALTSAGNINEGAGGVVIATQLTGASTGDTLLTGANKIASVGQFDAANFTLVDNAALSVVGPLHTTGNISLTTTGGPANVLNVGQALTGGSVTLDSAGDLSITQTVQGSAVNLTANGNLAVDAVVNSGAGATTLTQNGAGSISEGVGGSITAGTLSGTAQGGAVLNGANAISNLGDFTAVGFSLTNATALTVAAGATVDGGANTSLATTGAGSDLTIDGNVNGTATSLVSAGGINEGAAGVVTADTLTGSSAGATALTGNNAIAQLGNFTANGLQLNDGQSLAIAAGNTVDGGASTSLTTSGDLDVDGTLKGTTTTLAAGGAINEGAAGNVVAGTLAGSSGGATALTGNNAVASLGNFTAVGFALTSGQSLTVNAGASVDGGATTALTTTGSGHDIDINGTVKGNLVTLTSAGAIGEGAGGLVQGGDLTGSSVGATSLTQTDIDTLDAFSAADFALSNAGALTVAGPLATTGNAGNISLATTGAGNALTVSQAVQGASITLASAGDLTVANAVTGTQVGLAANGNLAIDAAVSSGAGATTLTQTGTGAITGGSNGSITAATLTGSATGTTTLGSASQFMDNHVGILGGFSSPAGFSFTNDGTLTLASVGGSAFTVDAGKAALYLEVRNGDLLQNGTNWLYDGTGSFSAPDGHIGLQTAPIYVTGVTAQSVPAIGLPPAYFYGIDYSGNLLPFTGSNAVNVPVSILSTKSQGTNGHSDQYIDISVVTAIYQGYGIVPTGLLLPQDQSACAPDQPPSELCPESN